MLSNLDWADRMAIPLPFVQAVGQPDGPAFMTALASWRWTAPKIDTDLWFRKMVTLRAPPLTVGQFDASSTAKSAFYDALLHKCLNLYGGSGRAADPLALARGVAIDVSRDDERVRQLGMLRENLAGYATVYRKEAAYRAKEGDAAMNS
jgi:hypothetical protein